MENKSEEKDENSKKLSFENTNDKLNNPDSNSIDSEIKNKNLFPSEETRYNSDNKSI